MSQSVWSRCAGAVVALVGGLVALELVGCETNATTGRSQFLGLSRQDEVQIGAQGKGELTQQFGGEVARTELRDYTREVGMKLVATTVQDDPTQAELPWEFTLLNSDVVNAFAIPGGKVFMSRGLAVKMTNEAQFAAVLGHEIGHVTARHTSERAGRMMGAQVGVGILGVLLGTGGQGINQLAGQITELALLKYDRKQELESDLLGMRYMTRCGYNPLGAKQVMDLLASMESSGRQPEMLSTHPDPARRSTIIQQHLQSDYAFTQSSSDYTLHEQEFRAKFLAKLALIPAPTREEELAAAELAAEAEAWRAGACCAGAE